MNREIKFRVFRITTKELFHPRSIEWNWNDGQMEIGMKSVSGTATIPTAPADEFIIMQYTGLKDKNGKEIYEGDILNCSRSGFQQGNFENIKSLVRWSEHPYSAWEAHPIRSEEQKNDENHGVFSHYTFGVHVFPSECEIIGNIFETNNQ